MTSIRDIQLGPTNTALKDLSLSVEWHDLRSLALPGTEWTIILGHKRRQDPLRAVLPLPLHTTALTPSALKAIFAALASLDASAIPAPLPPYVPSIAELQVKLGKKRSGEQEAMGDEEREESAETSVVNEEIDRDMIYTAISTTDSTVVYYRLSKGIKKPADIPDE